MWRILGIVDRMHLKNQIARTLGNGNKELIFESDLSSALKLLNQEAFHMLIVDDDVVGQNMEPLFEHLSEEQDLPLIILTNFRRGYARTKMDGPNPWTYIKKPINPEIFKTTVFGFLDLIRMPHTIDYLRHKQKYIYKFSNIIGSSPSVKAVISLVKKVASSNNNVLITGERGTGKKLISAAIHYNSPRRQENFVVVKCSTFSKTRMKSELFGHEKGSFSWANQRRIGRLEQANAGSIFLENIQDLSLKSQDMLLETLISKHFKRLGGHKRIKSDFRLICSTETELDQLINDGLFRKALAGEMKAIPIHLPPLRERKEDIPALAQFFLHKYRSEFGKHEVDFSPQSIGKLMEYDWPGNVLELEHVVERALLVCDSFLIEPECLMLAPQEEKAHSFDSLLSGGNLNLDELERAAIIEALSRANGVQKKAAEMLGISPRVIHYKIHKYNLAD